MTKLAKRVAGAVLLAGAAAAAPGCGPASRPAAAPIPSALLSQARPIGVGPRFRPAADGPVNGRCEQSLGPRSGVHVEVFGDNRVVLLPAGIGTRPPLTSLGGRITGARCYGALVTLDPTGLVLVRSAARLTLGALFRSWGQPLSRTQLASFRAPEGTHVAVYVDGRPWRGAPGAVPLTHHAEIVLEAGPYVPPHSSYTFPDGT